MTQIQTTQKRILEVHKINEPFGYAAIVEDPITHAIRYEVFEPTLTEEERKQLQLIRSFLIEQIDVTRHELGSEEEAKKYLTELVRRIVKDFHIPLNKHSLDKILYYIIRDYVGYGKIDVMMRDPLIEDISCSGVNVPIYVWHRKYESIPTNVFFTSDEELDSFAIRLAYRTGRMVSVANPILDSILPDGSRIQITLGRTVTRGGSSFTIRRFRADPLTVVDLIKFNTLSSRMAATLWYMVENKYNLLICGPTASGKTTTLNCLTCFIKPDLKIVTIEDTPELRLYHKNWIRSVTRPAFGGASEITLFDLLKAAMRQRPDYIIVGEIRGAEAYTLFQAMATGHGGLSTLHAESVEAAIHRLETEPMNIPRTLITSLNVIMIQRRMEMEGRPVRRIIAVTELLGLDRRTNEIVTNDTYKYRARDDSYSFSGRCYHLERIAKSLGRSLKDVMDEVDRRETVLKWMVKRNIRSFEEVTGVIRDFYANPERVYRVAKVGV